MSTSYDLIIELSRNEKLQKYRIILLQRTSYLHKMISPLFDMFICCVYFCLGKFLNMCKPGPRGLAFYGSGLAYLPSWLVNAAWLCSMWSGIFLQMKFFIFQGCPNKLPFYLGSLLRIISSLFSHFRSWDYL